MRHGVLGRIVIDRVISGVWMCNSFFNEVLYSFDMCAMLLVGPVTKCDNPWSKLKNISDKKRASSFHLALVLGEGRAQCRGQ